jgi:hypothetical protein
VNFLNDRQRIEKARSAPRECESILEPEPLDARVFVLTVTTKALRANLQQVVKVFANLGDIPDLWDRACIVVTSVDLNAKKRKSGERGWSGGDLFCHDD